MTLSYSTQSISLRASNGTSTPIEGGGSVSVTSPTDTILVCLVNYQGDFGWPGVPTPTVTRGAQTFTAIATEIAAQYYDLGGELAEYYHIRATIFRLENAALGSAMVEVYLAPDNSPAEFGFLSVDTNHPIIVVHGSDPGQSVMQSNLGVSPQVVIAPTPPTGNGMMIGCVLAVTDSMASPDYSCPIPVNISPSNYGYSVEIRATTPTNYGYSASWAGTRNGCIVGAWLDPSIDDDSWPGALWGPL